MINNLVLILKMEKNDGTKENPFDYNSITTISPNIFILRFRAYEHN
jgi:hypothetical protein